MCVASAIPETKEQSLVTPVASDVKTPIANGIDSLLPTPASVQPIPNPAPNTVTVPPTQQLQPITNSTTNAITENTILNTCPSEDVKERGPPPKAMVKPQVLTHVIEDFVIQESSEPFPVTRSGMSGDLKTTHPMDKENLDEPPRKKQNTGNGDFAKCEQCGTVDLRDKFKKNKRFCSVVCSKKFSVLHKTDKKQGDGKGGAWIGQGKEEQGEADDSAASGAESSLSQSEAHHDTEDSSASESTQPKINPLKWSVTDVCDFIRNLPGCSDYAEDFAIQEIDGQALMLLKEDHLMAAMAMKLGPALKIVAKIDDMRIDKEPPKQ